MKRLKLMLVLAAAALATMAAMTAASASATITVLCSESVKPCPAGKVQPPGSGFGFLTKEVAVHWDTDSYPGGYNEIRCNTTSSYNTLGSALFASTQESGEPLPAESEMILNVEGCKTFDNRETNCVSEVSINSPESFIHSSGPSSAMVIVGTQEEPLTVGATCKTIFGPRKCNYIAVDPVPLIFDTSTNQVTSAGVRMENTTSVTNGCANNPDVEFRYKGEFTSPYTGLISHL